jgi:hypothetical protein
MLLGGYKPPRMPVYEGQQYQTHFDFRLKPAAFRYPVLWLMMIECTKDTGLISRYRHFPQSTNGTLYHARAIKTPLSRCRPE